MNFWCSNPPKPSCKPKPKCNFYAQFAVHANPASGLELPMTVVFQNGNQIQLEEDSQILLAPGYLYLINYIFLATPEAGGCMQITPKINDTLRLLYACFAPAGNIARNASASGSFTTNEALIQEASLSFNLTYPATVRNIDISGAVSVTPLIKF